jgi:hypothetical protein
MAMQRKVADVGLERTTAAKLYLRKALLGG